MIARGRRRPPARSRASSAIAPYTRIDRAAALADGALVRHRPPAGLALPRARAVPPPRAEPRAARVAADPALDVPLPLRHGARRPPAGRTRCRRRSSRCASGRARCGSSAATLRRGTIERADAVREDLGDARRRRAAGRAGAALHRPAPRARGDEPAGVRVAAARGPAGAPARPDDRDDGPQRPDRAAARSATRSRRRSSTRSPRTARSSACR